VDLKIDIQSIEIPHTISYLLKKNGNQLLVSAYASAREIESCKFLVNHDIGCKSCGKRLVRFACVTPHMPFNEDWYTAYFQFVGFFRNCKCQISEDHRTSQIPKIDIQTILDMDKKRILNGYLSTDELQWRVSQGLLTDDEVSYINGIRKKRGKKEFEFSPKATPVSGVIDEVADTMMSPEDVPF